MEWTEADIERFSKKANEAQKFGENVLKMITVKIEEDNIDKESLDKNCQIVSDKINELLRFLDKKKYSEKIAINRVYDLVRQIKEYCLGSTEI